MNALLKIIGGVACFMDAFDDAKIPRLKSSSADDDYENENDAVSDGAIFYRSSADSNYSPSMGASCESDDSCNEDADECDSAVEMAVTAARIGRVLRVVDRANYIAACRR